MRVRCLPLGVILAAGLMSAGTASADPVLITTGEITITGVQDLFSRGFLRTIRFNFETATFQTSGGEVDGPTQDPLSPALLTPVTLIRSGVAPEIAGLTSVLTVTAAPSPVPTRFELTGALSFFNLSTGAPILSETVSGRGTATWQFVTAPNGAPIVSGVTYQFSDDAAVPEPTTVLLVSAGLAAMAARRVRRRRGRVDPGPTAN